MLKPHERQKSHLQIILKRFALPISGIAFLIISFPVGASRLEPVPIYGNYDAYLDHSKQTFNDRPAGSKPSTQAASFTTFCDTQGCVAHWLRVTELKENPNAPALFDYQWQNGRWESKGEYPFHCNDGSIVTANRFDFIKPTGNGKFSGERVFVVSGQGCPGEGPGKYWLPFTLTPKNHS